MTGFYLGTRDLNSVPHAWIASTLPMEPSPDPPFSSFFILLLLLDPYVHFFFLRMSKEVIELQNWPKIKRVYSSNQKAP